MDEAGERPGREEQAGGEGVQLEEERGAGDRLGLGLEGEEAAEPDGDGAAVVVAVAEDVVGGRGGDAEQHGGRQQREEDLVAAVGAEPDPPGQQAAGAEHAEAGDHGDAGDRAGPDGGGVVRVLADAHRLGPGGGYGEPDHMAGDHHEGAEMEQRAAPAQPAVFEELAGVGGPAELVVPVAPDMSYGEHGEADAGDGDPQQQVGAGDVHRLLSSSGVVRGRRGRRGRDEGVRRREQTARVRGSATAFRSASVGDGSRVSRAARTCRSGESASVSARWISSGDRRA
jgi:hypothetical protein